MKIVNTLLLPSIFFHCHVMAVSKPYTDRTIRLSEPQFWGYQNELLIADLIIPPDLEIVTVNSDRYKFELSPNESSATFGFLLFRNPAEKIWRLSKPIELNSDLHLIRSVTVFNATEQWHGPIDVGVMFKSSDGGYSLDTNMGIVRLEAGSNSLSNNEVFFYSWDTTYIDSDNDGKVGEYEISADIDTTRESASIQLSGGFKLEKEADIWTYNALSCLYVSNTTTTIRGTEVDNIKIDGVVGSREPDSCLKLNNDDYIAWAGVIDRTVSSNTWADTKLGNRRFDIENYVDDVQTGGGSEGTNGGSGSSNLPSPRSSDSGGSSFYILGLLLVGAFARRVFRYSN